MRRFILFLFACLSSMSVAFAQFELGGVTATLGEEINVTKGKIVKIVGEVDGKIYALANKKKKYYLNVFGSQRMNLISMKEIKMPSTAKKELVFERVEKVGNKIYLLGSRYLRNKKSYVLNAFEITQSGQVKQGAKRLFTVRVEKHSERGEFAFKMSPDKKQLVGLYATIHSKKNQAHYQIRLFDEGMKRLASKDQRVNFEDRKDAVLTVDDFDVNLKGDLFVAVSEGYYDRKRKKYIDNFTIFAYKKANEYKKDVIKVDLAGHKVLSTEIIANSDNTLNIVGFYSPSKKNGKLKYGLKGVYSTVIDLNGNKVLRSNRNDFDYETKVQIIGKRKAGKDKDLNLMYAIRNIIEKQDGGLLLLSEASETIYGKPQGLGVVMTPVTYYRKEVIVTSLDKTGKTEWTRVIPKKQRVGSQIMSFGIGAAAATGSGMVVSASIQIPFAQLGKGPEYLGFIPFYHKGELSILFNDTVKNKGVINVDDAKWMTKFNNSIPAIFTISKDGKMTRKDSEGIDKTRLVVRPGVYKRKSPSDYLIYASRKSQNKLGRIFLKGSQKKDVRL